MWQERIRPFVETGKLVAVGVVQEQHPDRARLYAQWRRLNWPIFVDSFNLLDVAVVPVPVAIDESGIRRLERVSPNNIVERFINAEFPRADVPDRHNRAPDPDAALLGEQARTADTARAWREFGDACILLRDGPSVEARATCDAVAAYRRAVELDPSDGRAQFRLGVALHRRSESRHRRPDDAQHAVAAWGRALAIDPNQYIWRRRIQQYGPRLDKPYNFYFWVKEARKQIAARGETPVALSVEPAGSEIEAPARAMGRRDSDESRSPRQTEACGTAERVQVDVKKLINIEPVVTPARVRPGHTVRVRVTLRVNPRSRPYWNNEADDLTLCVQPPDTLSLGEGSLSHPNPPQPETQENRAIEFEFAVADGVAPGRVDIPVHALYYVCENKGGKCRFLRQTFSLSLHVDPAAPTIR